MATHKIPLADFVVNEFGLHASTGEREYPIDGISVEFDDLYKHLNKESGMNDELFYAVKVHGFQESIDNSIVYYTTKK